MPFLATEGKGLCEASVYRDYQGVGQEACELVAPWTHPHVITNVIPN